MFSLTQASWPVHLLQRSSSPWPGRSCCLKIELLLLLLPWEELFNGHLLNLIQVRTPSWRPWLLSPPRWLSSPRSRQPSWSSPHPSRSPPSRLLDARPVLGSKGKGITVILSITCDVQVVTIPARLELAQVARDHISDGWRGSTGLRLRDNVGLKREPVDSNHLKLAVAGVARADAVVLGAVLQPGDQALDQSIAPLAKHAAETENEEKSSWRNHCGAEVRVQRSCFLQRRWMVVGC